MKTRLLSTIVFATLFLTTCSMERVVLAQGDVAVYTRIPVAPNVVLTVGVPAIAAPSPDHIWVEGYWTWDTPRREYIWVQGYWALAPYVGAYWVPGYWEYYASGYRWVDAYWIPRNTHLAFGYYDGRYDYYGRPVYYHRPASHPRGYAYGYDHDPKHRTRRYSSSVHFNESSREERDRINREHKRTVSSAGSRQESTR
ncbi:MAG: hypothetical protein LBH61_05440, partial [Dysgonamonadaceae bacterium]|nr:hypothetical protein [Dysgonamonadaceae bacterium]